MATAVALIVSPICRVHLQWVPFRCGVDGNENTDTVAKEAAEFPQARVPVDDRIRPPTARPPERLVAVGDRSSLSVKCAPVPRRPLPGRVTTISLPNREESHRGMPADCSDNSRFAGRCIVCRREEGTKHRDILRCPGPMGVMRLRLLRLGTVLPSPQEGREDRDVWTLGAAMKSLQGRAAAPQ